MQAGTYHDLIRALGASKYRLAYTAMQLQSANMHMRTQATLCACQKEHALLAYGQCTPGESRAIGEKGHKTLLSTVLPRLAQYEIVPATLVAQLLQLIDKTDDK